MNRFSRVVFVPAVTVGSFLPCVTFAADNCTGYDISATTMADTRDVGEGMTLTTFQQENVVMSVDTPNYQNLTGQCAGTVLTMPDGRIFVTGHCVRRDKDGHTQAIEWGQAAGAEKGSWKELGGTGKFANAQGTGWFQEAHADGKSSVVKWGGTCK